VIGIGKAIFGHPVAQAAQKFWPQAQSVLSQRRWPREPKKLLHPRVALEGAPPREWPPKFAGGTVLWQSPS